jgi:hypothetical protein
MLINIIILNRMRIFKPFTLAILSIIKPLGVWVLVGLGLEWLIQPKF